MCAGRITAIVLLVLLELEYSCSKTMLFPTILLLYILVLWLAELGLIESRKNGVT